MTKQKKRPFFLNLFKIHLPVSGIVSILHRISGVLLFLSLPFWLYLLELSLISAEGFEQVGSLLQSGWLMPVYVFLLWAILHHLLAGIRFLLLDIDVAISKPLYRKSAMAVLFGTPALVLLGFLVML